MTSLTHFRSFRNKNRAGGGGGQYVQYIVIYTISCEQSPYKSFRKDHVN
jgi:hypothetical protein